MTEDRTYTVSRFKPLALLQKWFRRVGQIQPSAFAGVTVFIWRFRMLTCSCEQWKQHDAGMNACCGFPRHKSHSIQYLYYLYPFSFLSLSLHPLFSLAPSIFPYLFLLSLQTVHFSFSQTTSPLLLLAPYFMLQPSSSNRCNYLIISHCEELEEVVDSQRPTSMNMTLFLPYFLLPFFVG